MKNMKYLQEWEQFSSLKPKEFEEISGNANLNAFFEDCISGVNSNVPCSIEQYILFARFRSFSKFLCSGNLVLDK